MCHLCWTIFFVQYLISFFRLSSTCRKCVQLYKDTIMFEKSCNLRLFLLLYDTAWPYFVCVSHKVDTRWCTYHWKKKEWGRCRRQTDLEWGKLLNRFVVDMNDIPWLWVCLDRCLEFSNVGSNFEKIGVSVMHFCRKCY